MTLRRSAAVHWAIAGLALVLALAWARHRMQVAAVFDDAPTFLSAPRVALDGGSPYSREALAAYFRDWVGKPRQAFPFLYPPPFLLMSAWTLGFDRFEVAREAWFAVNVGSALALAWRLAAWSGIAARTTLFAVVAMHATAANWQVGNVNIALALLLLEAVMRASGAWLAVGVLVKISPAVALAGLVVQRRWRGLLAFAATVLVLCLATVLVFPASLFRTFASDVLPALHGGNYGMEMPALTLQRNHGFSRLLVHLGDDPSMSTLSAAANRLRGGLAAAMTLGVAWSCRHEVPRSAGLLRAAGGYGLVMILCAPIAWDHHLVLALAAVAYAWSRATAAGSPRGRAAVGGAYVLLALPEDWWQGFTYLVPEVAGPLGCLKLGVLVALYAVCLRAPAQAR